MTRLLRRWGLFVLWSGITLANIRLLPDQYLPVVSVEVVHAAPLALVVRSPGVLEPKKSLTIKAEFDGPILSKDFQEGKAVRQGQPLLEIGRDKIRLDYGSKEIAVKNAEADVEKARKDAELQHALYKQMAVSRSSVEDAERAVVRAAQALETAQAAFGMELQRWRKSRIVAPFSGTVIKDALGDERQVMAGRDLLTLADLSEYSLRARVDELEIGQIKIDQPAEVRIQAYGDQTLQAKVLRIGAQAEGSALPEIPVYLQLASTAGLPLLPRLTAETRIYVGQTPPVLSVPLEAVDNQDGIPKIWVLTSSNRIERRTIGVGKANPERVEVTQGLVAGERVCLAPPSAHLAEGMKVKVK